MRRGRDWLLVGLIAAGVVVLGLLLLAFVPGLGRWTGMWGPMGRFCPWCGGRGTTGPWNFLGGLLLCGLPLVLLALVVLGVVWFASSQGRSTSPPPGTTRCPACGQAVQPGWRACPYCGEPLEEG